MFFTKKSAKKYFFAVMFIALLFSGCSGGSSSGESDSGDGSAPEIPLGLTVDTPTSNSLGISWQNTANADGYRLYRATDIEGTYSQVDGDITSVTSYTDTGLSSSTTYYYKISAYNTYGESEQSAPESGTTTDITGATPETPTGLAVSSPTSSSLHISWNSTASADGYRLYRSTTSGGTYTQAGSDITGATAYTDNGLNSSTTYYYKISAYNMYGSSAQSGYVSGATTAAVTAPATPAGLAVGSPTASSLYISWNVTAGASGYRLYRSASSGGTYTQVGSDITGTTSYTNTGLSSSTTYYYKISAYNAIGESAQSAYASGTTTAAGSAPATPTGLAVSTPTSSSLSISWNSSSGANGYRLYRSTTSGGTYTKVGSDITGATAYINTGLNSATTYYYKISAYNTYGESAQSGYVSGTTLATTGTIRIQNNSTLAIDRVYISSGATWGSDLLSSVINSGGYHDFTGITAGITNVLVFPSSTSQFWEFYSTIVTANNTTTLTITNTGPSTASLRIVNNSSYDIYIVYVALNSSTSWGPDQLTTTISHGGGIWQLNNIPTGYYDFHAEYNASNYWETTYIELSDGELYTWTLID